MQITIPISILTSVQGSLDYRFGVDVPLNATNPETIVNFNTANLTLPFMFPVDSAVPTN